MKDKTYIVENKIPRIKWVNERCVTIYCTNLFMISINYGITWLGARIGYMWIYIWVIKLKWSSF